MRNMFIEGIQGAGKTTLLNAIATQLTNLRICREGDYSPVDLAWCSWMTEKEYQDILERYQEIEDDIKKNTYTEESNKGNMITESRYTEGPGSESNLTDNIHYIITYTKIITDIPGFHKELEKYEIYNARKSLEELQEIYLDRYRNFTQEGFIFECAFFQNLIEDLLLFHQLSDNEIVDFYRVLFGAVKKEKFLLLYLKSDALEDNIRKIKSERSDNLGNEMWYPMMLQYFVTSPYGVKNGLDSFEDLLAHFKHRQDLELRIIEEVLGDNAIVLPSKGWTNEDIRKVL